MQIIGFMQSCAYGHLYVDWNYSIIWLQVMKVGIQ